MKSYIIGSKDKNGYVIKKILSRGDEYMIYEIETNSPAESIRLLIDTLKEEDVNGIVKNYNKVKSKFIEVKGVIYKVFNDDSIKNRIALALSAAFDGDIDGSIKSFDNLIEEINNEYNQRNKKKVYLLLTSILFILLNVWIGIFVYWYASVWTENVHLIIYSIICGSLGGFISLSYKMNSISFERNVDSKIYIFYGIERILISMLGSFVIFMGCKSNLIFGFINELQSNMVFGYMLLGVLAGFSENLVPNFLAKLETDNT